MSLLQNLSKIRGYITKKMPWTDRAFKRSEAWVTQAADKMIARQILKKDFNAAASGQNTPAYKAQQARERLQKSKEKDMRSRIATPVSTSKAVPQKSSIAKTQKSALAKISISSSAAKPQQKQTVAKSPAKGKAI